MARRPTGMNITSALSFSKLFSTTFNGTIDTDNLGAPPLSAFSSSFSPSGVKNENYNVEEYYREKVLHALQNDESIRNSMAYSLAMASVTTANNVSSTFRIPPLDEQPLSEMMRRQLKYSKGQLKHPVLPSFNHYRQQSQAVDQRPLPRTVEDALRLSSRAIVITETQRPFRIQHVNKAWEELCGFSYLEAKDQSLGHLLAGDNTDASAVGALLNQLLHGEDATTILNNYTKSGREFKNRLHVGPLYDEHNQIESFVGVLQEV